MRDPSRINYVVRLLELVWNKYPDLRFIQLIEFIKSVTNVNFYSEDDIITLALQEVILANTVH